MQSESHASHGFEGFSVKNHYPSLITPYIYLYIRGGRGGGIYIVKPYVPRVISCNGCLFYSASKEYLNLEEI